MRIHPAPTGPASFRVVLILALLLPFSGDSVVKEGASRDQVLAEWGKPQVAMTAGPKEFLTYAGGIMLELKDGVVIRIRRIGTGRRPTHPKAAPRFPRRKSTGTTAFPSPFVSCARQEKDIQVLPVTWSPGPWTDLMFWQCRGKRRKTNRLLQIARRGDVEKCRTILEEANFNVDDADELGRTVLHYMVEQAAWPGRCVRASAVIETLLEYGADPDTKDRLGQTPLHWAARRAPRVIKLLVDAGANIDATDRDGRTPLHWAVLAHQDEARDLLISLGADEDIKDHQGLTITDIAREQARWVLRLKKSHKIGAVAFGNHTFVAGGAWTGSVWASPDGAAWRSFGLPDNSGLAHICFAGTEFIAWSAHQRMYFSSNGVAWRRVRGDENARHLCFAAAGRDRIIAMGDAATVLHSPDGRTWQPLPEGVAGNVVGVCWTGDHFSAMTKDRMLLWSRDGLHWGVSKLDLRGFVVKRMCRAGPFLYAVGNFGLMLRSREGVHWRQIPVPAVSNLNGVAWGGGRYVAVGDHGTVLMSCDGKTWDIIGPPTELDFLDVAFGDNAFVAAGRDGIWSYHCD